MRRKQPASRAGARRSFASPAAALLAIGGLACHHDGAPTRDGSVDVAAIEATNPLTLDIAVTGCERFDLQGSCAADGNPGPCCTGGPPLTLAFAPVGSPDLVQFLWKFGDGTPDTTDRAPSHTYAHPGHYPVTLVGVGPSVGGTTPPRPLTVVVEPLAAGMSCDVDAQCGDGLACWCAPGDGCPAAFVRGVCAAACDAASCGAGSSCAVVPFAAASTDAATGPRAQVCLASCATDAAAPCAPGLTCRTLPAAGAPADAPWTAGCLPLGALQDVGASCRDANDVLSDAACGTGLCADLGALGVCSAACDEGQPCPTKTTCARQTDGRKLCLARCDSDADCVADPLLACAAAAPADADGGDLISVCRPRSCSSDAACGVAGRCGPNGVCVRK